jgi:signal peptidase I
MRSRSLSKALRLAGATGLLALVALGALTLVPAALGYQRYVIEGGSMGASVPRGSIAYERTAPVDRLAVGDVITYVHEGARVTHRIVSIGRKHDGQRLFRTRGDANATPDPWRFALPDDAQAVLRFHVPLAGYLLAALSIRPVRMLAIGLPALAIAAIALAGAWREPREVEA